MEKEKQQIRRTEMRCMCMTYTAMQPIQDNCNLLFIQDIYGICFQNHYKRIYESIQSLIFV